MKKIRDLPNLKKKHMRGLYNYMACSTSIEIFNNASLFSLNH